MPNASDLMDYSARDRSIAINSYTTVLRHPQVPHDLFATYWRDVHGPLCARIPGLGFYVQQHFSRTQDAHLWPAMKDIARFPDYDLDGGVEIGFRNAAAQTRFNEACPILFADEQNMFAATVAYALPNGSRTLVDRLPEASPNAEDDADRIHVHFGARHADAARFSDRMTAFAEALAACGPILKVRLHQPDTYDNQKPAPPAPNVGHTVPPERRLMAMLELAFASPLARRAVYHSDAFRAACESLGDDVAHASPFAVSGVYTYVRDDELTLAGLRGSRPAQLIERLGAVNQTREDVRHLLMTGKLAD
ncbi:hypothetical protein ASG25_19815 [Rhizobium sp. Leaf384]|uniref:hypothetical protein n=1 Tax=unclassified Rhizobium TaxID=2613769 RepID=UPI0007149FDC|nr:MULTISPECIES: hypothetical protein [unclassified Rhizobium]KQS75732.1 hypothetical protein ASG25_19815 [Rhizobium sp. Leaf384]KQS75991.1 hypothetical protein ASG58_13495 [Rhizobium sp. Leaf383]